MPTGVSPMSYLGKEKNIFFGEICLDWKVSNLKVNGKINT
jgi:hypothetical protein